MKGERAFLKKLAQREIGEDEFYEKEIKFSKSKKISTKPKRNKAEWDS